VGDRNNVDSDVFNIVSRFGCDWGSVVVPAALDTLPHNPLNPTT